MSQQINLLAREGKPLGSALWALAVVLVALTGLLSYAVVLQGEKAQLKREADSIQRQLTQASAALQAMRQAADANKEAATVRTEIDSLKIKAEAAKQWLEQIRSGSLGSAEGYAHYLDTLAGVSEDGVWLTSISVGNAGKLLTLSGRALRNESVLRYAKRLNEAFTAQGVQFNSVELTPENLVKGGIAGGLPLGTVAFKLF